MPLFSRRLTPEESEALARQRGGYNSFAPDEEGQRITRRILSSGGLGLTKGASIGGKFGGLPGAIVGGAFGGVLGIFGGLLTAEETNILYEDANQQIEEALDIQPERLTKIRKIRELKQKSFERIAGDSRIDGGTIVPETFGKIRAKGLALTPVYLSNHSFTGKPDADTLPANQAAFAEGRDFYYYDMLYSFGMGPIEFEDGTQKFGEISDESELTYTSSSFHQFQRWLGIRKATGGLRQFISTTDLTDTGPLRTSLSIPDRETAIGLTYQVERVRVVNTPAIPAAPEIPLIAFATLSYSRIRRQYSDGDLDWTNGTYRVPSEDYSTKLSQFNVDALQWNYDVDVLLKQFAEYQKKLCRGSKKLY